jgi:hypothetical protein
MLMKFLRRGAIGFPLGILVSLVISWATGNDRLVSDLLVQRVGSAAGALTLDLFLSGIFGFLCMGGTAFYEIENWSPFESNFPALSDRRRLLSSPGTLSVLGDKTRRAFDHDGCADGRLLSDLADHVPAVQGRGQRTE